MARAYEGELSATQAMLGILAELPGASASAIGTELKKRFSRARFDSAYVHKMLPRYAERRLVRRLDATDDGPGRAEDRYVLLDPGQQLVEILMYAAPEREPPRRDALYARLELCNPQRLPALIARKEGEVTVLEDAFGRYKRELLERLAVQGDWRMEMDVLQLGYLSETTLSTIRRIRRVIERLRAISAAAGRDSIDIITNTFCADGELSASIAVLAVVVGNPGADVSTIADVLVESFDFAPFRRKTAFNCLETLEGNGLVCRRTPHRRNIHADDRVEPTETGKAVLEEWMYAPPKDIPPVRDPLCGRLELCQPKHVPGVIAQIDAEADVFANASVIHRHILQDREKLMVPGNHRAEIEAVQLEYRAEYALERTRRLRSVKQQLETILAEST